MGESITELSPKVGVDLSLGAPVREPPPTSGTTRLQAWRNQVRLLMQMLAVISYRAPHALADIH
jgi:hypothetical protein